MAAAEVESMTAELEPMAAAAAESMTAAMDWRCTIRDCECRWVYPVTPRIGPGIDHIGFPTDGDHRPAWSLLVGVTDGASPSPSIRVSRIRVARSGRILGRSDDKLEVFHDMALAKPPGYAFGAGAALDPDGLWLCVLPKDYDEQHQTLQLSLIKEEGTAELSHPDIQGTSDCMPFSYAGHIWALSATTLVDDDDFPPFVTSGTSKYFGYFSVVTRRLLRPEVGGGRWEKVGDSFTTPLLHLKCPPWNGGFLQGYAVLPGAKLILVSFQQYGLFLTFAPHSGCWATVRTDRKRSQEYLPIHGRGIYMELHDAVYMLSCNTIYAYKPTLDHDGQLSLDPPIKIHSVCPFRTDAGYGYLTRLADRLLCSVWISLASDHPCPCDHLHAIVTTFHLPDPAAAQGGIQVLHSTYRRVDVVPHPPDQTFCFLQEFEDQGSPELLQHEEKQEDSSQHVKQPSKKLACCRALETIGPKRTRCFQCGDYGHLGRNCSQKRNKAISTMPPLGPSRGLPVDPSSRQHQVPSSSPVVTVNPAIKKDVFIICQVGSQSVVFQTGAMDEDYEPLHPCFVADDGDHYWQFFLSGSKINAVSSDKNGMLEFGLDKYRTILKRPVPRPTAAPFIMASKVGGVTIALTDTLQVFHQEKFHYGSSTWLRYTTTGLNMMKVLMSGYAVVNDDSLIICDAVTCSCLLFDLSAKQWRYVMPLAAFEEDLPRTVRTNGLLNGRCVFVDGFIYTCRNGGLAAYELARERSSVYISKPIFLPFSWHPDCVDEGMCLDYAGKDESGSLWFYVVVRGGYSPPNHDVQITTVKVKTKRTAGYKMIPAGIEHVCSVTRFIRHNEPVDTRCCFAVSCP